MRYEIPVLEAYTVENLQFFYSHLLELDSLEFDRKKWAKLCI